MLARVCPNDLDRAVERTAQREPVSRSCGVHELEMRSVMQVMIALRRDGEATRPQRVLDGLHLFRTQGEVDVQSDVASA